MNMMAIQILDWERELEIQQELKGRKRNEGFYPSPDLAQPEQKKFRLFFNWFHRSEAVCRDTECRTA